MVKSNVVTVTVAGATPSIQISVSPTSIPASGGTVTISGTTNLPSGTTLYIFANNTNVGSVTVGSGGSFSATYQIPPNTSTQPVYWSFFVADTATIGGTI